MRDEKGKTGTKVRESKKHLLCVCVFFFWCTEKNRTVAIFSWVPRRWLVPGRQMSRVKGSVSGQDLNVKKTIVMLIQSRNLKKKNLPSNLISPQANSFSHLAPPQREFFFFFFFSLHAAEHYSTDGSTRITRSVWRTSFSFAVLVLRGQHLQEAGQLCTTQDPLTYTVRH